MIHGAAVCDEGEEIRLDDDISERISKARKREGLVTPEQAQAIAEAVFARIDRKAAEPKRHANGGKGELRVRQLLADDLTPTPEERLMLESPHEILLVHTPEGRLKEAVMGNARTVTIPDRLPAGAILSHNHRSGRGPSDSDIKAVLVRPGVTLRIVTVNEGGRLEIFSLMAIGNPSPDEIKVITETYKAAAEAGGDTPAARRDALALILQIAGNSLLAVSRILP